MDFNLTNQHKSLLITCLIAGTVVLSIFNLGLEKHSQFLSESYYEIAPEEEPTLEDTKILEAQQDINPDQAETNNAFNETVKNKHFAQAYKTIEPPKDYIPKSENASETKNTHTKYNQIEDDYNLNGEALSAFNKVKNVLDKQSGEYVNTKSTIKFSLKGRKKVFIPIPIYLCEVQGKIIINITVNAQGKVINSYVNNASTSTNACLIEHAMEYAKDSRFSEDLSKNEQIGSITFNFIGKN